NMRKDGSNVTDNWCDYPQIGIDYAQIYITCNMYTFADDSNFQYSKIRVMTKSQFVNNACCAWTDIWGMNDVFHSSFSVSPAHMYGADASTPMFLANAHGGGGDESDLSIWRIREAWRCCGEPGDPQLDH